MSSVIEAVEDGRELRQKKVLISEEEVKNAPRDSLAEESEILRIYATKTAIASEMQNKSLVFKEKEMQLQQNHGRKTEAMP